MMPQLRQLNVSYNEAEDRLLLKVSTADDAEYRAWFTRRFTRLLLDKLEGLFEDEVAESPAIPEPARREVAQMQHKQEVDNASFKRGYEAEPSSYPLGEEGLLITVLKYGAVDKDTVQMHLGDKQGKGIPLRLNRSYRHQLYELFLRAAERAQWFEPREATASALVH